MDEAYERGVRAGRDAMRREIREALGIAGTFMAGPVISEWRVTKH